MSTTPSPIERANCDKEHAQIATGLERLRSAVEAPSFDREAALKAFRDLATAVEDHFRHEEEMLSRADYPGLRPHLRQHEALAGVIAEFGSIFLDDPSPASGGDLYQVTHTALQLHEFNSDAAFDTYFSLLPVRC